jgi:hypothetical protein
VKWHPWPDLHRRRPRRRKGLAVVGGWASSLKDETLGSLIVAAGDLPTALRA